MELDLTPDETSLLTGMLVVWKTRIPHEKYEDMLIDSMLQKIFDEDKKAVDKILLVSKEEQINSSEEKENEDV